MWNTDQLNANGEVQIGNGTNPPTSTTLTASTNCSITNGANSIQIDYTGSAGGGFIYLDSATASTSSSIEFTDLSNSYYAYVVVFDAVVSSTGVGVGIAMRTSTNNGSSYDSGASDYCYSFDAASDILGSPAVVYGYLLTNRINLGLTSGVVWIINPSNTQYTRILEVGTAENLTGIVYCNKTSGTRLSTTPVDAIQFLYDGDTIASGTFKLYGVVGS